MLKLEHMITDQETNFVYFSERLKKDHPKFLKKLRAILKRERIDYGPLPCTSNNENHIWCRDYMPIQVSKDLFIQFKYDPCYLRGSKKAITSVNGAAKACKKEEIKVQPSELRVDGGNIVKSRTKVIMTDRVFCENPQYSKEQLVGKIRKALKVKQIIIIPQCSDDPFGHADGMVRFLDGVENEKDILVNDYNFSKEPTGFKEELLKTLKKEGLNPLPEIPYNPYGNEDDLDATGIYINYLQVGKIVIYPTYGIREDALAHDVFTSHFGEYVFPIRANAIAEEGGVLNCVSWNISV